MAKNVNVIKVNSIDEGFDVVVEKFRESPQSNKVLVTGYDDSLLKMVEKCHYFFACHMSNDDIADFRYALDDQFDITAYKTVIC